MNKNLFRIVFNAARGQLMVVGENASAHSASVSSGVGSPPYMRRLVRAMALVFGSLGSLSAYAQIVADPSAPANQRPTVLQTANGVPQVNIQTPNAAGVSRNSYRQFDVPAKGTILNNSRVDTTTQLGGWVQGNPWLATGSARVIVSEVNSANPSQLRGYIEVAGPRTEIVVANPNGILVDGGGFINASRATLTTGTPTYDTSGNLNAYKVRSGGITIDGAGLDARDVNYTAIIGRAVQANAGIWAQELDVIAGVNDVSAAGGAATAQSASSGTETAPAVAIDVSLLGGMYANKIRLISSEAGVGVNNAGNIGAAAGDVTVDASGWIGNNGTIAAAGNLTIQAKGDVNNSTGRMMATGSATIDTRGQTFNNTSGRVQVNDALSLTASLIVNDSTYNPSDTSTDLTGIQANQAQLNVNTLSNQQGRIATNNNLTLSVGQTLDNAHGLVSSGGDLSAQTASTAQPTQIINAHGTLIADNDLTLKLDTIDLSGAIKAQHDVTLDATTAMRFAGSENLVADHDLSITTTSDFTNTGDLSSGHGVSIVAANIENTANATMGTTNTQLHANNRVENRGVINGTNTTIESHDVHNTGTGRIYGDKLNITAHGSLVNDSETVNGARSDAVIASRGDLNIGAASLTNRDNALMLSMGDMNIGGSLDDQQQAIVDGSHNASFFNNKSATMESLGNLRIAADTLVNANDYYETQVQRVLSEPVVEYQHQNGDVYRASDTSTRFAASEVTVWGCESMCMSSPAGTSDAFIRYDYTRNVDESVVTQSSPGKIYATGGISILALTATNDKSEIVAGDVLEIQGATMNNIAGTGTQTTTDSGTATSYWRSRRKGTDTYGTSTTGYAPAATTRTISLNTAQFAGHSESTAANTLLSNTPEADAANDQPNILTSGGSGAILPTSALFKTNPNSGNNYLVEIDPAFTNRKQWLSSDYLLTAVNADPATVQKRLGDGFYEQRLINEQVAQLTGRRFLGNYTSDEQQYMALMNNGSTFAQAYPLRPGVALTPEQIAQLTTDIVWLVTQEVTLPDGSKTQALAPQVYAAVRPGDLDGSGALLSANTIDLNLTGDLTNSGSIAGRKVTRISAENIANLGGSVQGDAVSLAARQDLNNVGGSISGVSAAVATAGRDLNLATTTISSTNQIDANNFSRTAIDRVAGLYVSDAAGVLLASAGRDVNLTAAVLQSAGTLSVAAGRDLNAQTVTTAETENINWNSRNYLRTSESTEVGAVMQSNGNASLSAGQDATLRAVNIQGDADLSVAADRNVNITAGQSTTNSDSATFTTSDGFLSSSSRETKSHLARVDAVSSELGGQNVTITSGADTTVAGSNVVADKDLNINATGDVTVTTVDTQYVQNSFRKKTESGLLSGGGLGITIGERIQSTDQHAEGATVVGSTLGSVGGNINITSGGRYTQTGSDVLAVGQAPADSSTPSTAPLETQYGNVNITAQSIDITEAREKEQQRTQQKFSQSGLTIALSAPAIEALQGTMNAVEATGKTKSSRMQALGAASAAMSGLDAIDKFKSAGDAIQRGDVKDAGIKIAITIGGSSSDNVQTSQSDISKRSSIQATNGVTLKATGAAQDSNIVVRGSDIDAGGDVALSADNQIKLQAAQDNFQERTKSSSASAQVGVAIAVGGSKNGFGFTASASLAKANGNGDATAQQNTHVNAGKTLRINSGGDTTLQGAVASGERVQTEVGGDLNISSVQDTATYKSKSANIAGSIMIGADAGGGGSLGAGMSNVDANYASVNETSGLRAGDQGFDVKVKGDTSLVGAQITSTQAAVDAGANHFETGGQLAMADVQNRSNYEANSISVSTSGGGIGHDNGHEASATSAGVSGIAGKSSVRTGDAETGIGNNFDKTSVQEEVDAQVQITQSFGRQASKAVGDYAGKQMDKASALLEQAANTSDPDQKAALLAEAKGLVSDWGEDGIKRVALHAVIGGLTGGAAGAVGATAGTLTAPAVADALQSAGIDPQGALGASITALASTASGALAGGGTAAGAVTAFNEVTNNFLSHAENQARLKAATACASGDGQACQERDRLNALDQTRDANLKAACHADGSSAKCSAYYAAMETTKDSYIGQTESGSTLVAAGAQGLYGYTDAAEKDSIKPLLNVPHANPEGLAKLTSTVKFLANMGADFTPGVGELKAFYEAQDGWDYTFAIMGVIPGVGDFAAKSLKEGRALYFAGDFAGAAKKLSEANQALHGVDIDTIAVADRLSTYQAATSVKAVNMVEAGAKGSWSKTANGALEADSAYVLSNGHGYLTDASGRVKAVEGELSLNTMDRNNYQQLCAGQSGCAGDDGGHLIASSLGGAGDRINIVPQASTLNRREWKQMENFLRDQLAAGKKVSVKIDVGYPASGGVRPDGFVIEAVIDGQPYKKAFTQ